MVVPTMLSKMIVEINSDVTIEPEMILKPFIKDKLQTSGIPTLYKWSSGNITINKRFINLLMPKLQIMKIADSVGNILDEEGNLIISGSDLISNKLYDINVISSKQEYVATEGEIDIIYKYYADIVLSIDPITNGIESITIEEV